MHFDTFNYDTNHATVIREEKRIDANGNVIVKTTYENGVILIYTKTKNGYEEIDTNYELVRQVNGYYISDLTSPKRDFKDYY